MNFSSENLFTKDNHRKWMNDIHFQGERTGKWYKVSCVRPLEFVCCCGRSVPKRSRRFILSLPTPVRNRPAAQEEEKKPEPTQKEIWFLKKKKIKKNGLITYSNHGPFVWFIKQKCFGFLKKERNGFWNSVCNLFCRWLTLIRSHMPLISVESGA